MTTAYSFSPSQLAFYPNALREIHYEPLNAWPGDAVEISDAIAALYMTPSVPAGKVLGSENDMPAWVDAPPLTNEQQVAMAEERKQLLIDAANEYMNSKQWPGKAALGRLKGDELADYNAWLDCLDALEAIDTATAPDITWPEQPTV